MIRCVMKRVPTRRQLRIFIYAAAVKSSGITSKLVWFHNIIYSWGTHTHESVQLPLALALLTFLLRRLRFGWMTQRVDSSLYERPSLPSRPFSFDRVLADDWIFPSMSLQLIENKKTLLLSTCSTLDLWTKTMSKRSSFIQRYHQKFVLNMGLSHISSFLSLSHSEVILKRWRILYLFIDCPPPQQQKSNVIPSKKFTLMSTVAIPHPTRLPISSAVYFS